ncbi:MAG: hypothetical protein QNJ45_28540 [Ardenticatenaceae bacterium]|nr:hypothetical protein [Ardenticatenaceae bacterium]
MGDQNALAHCANALADCANPPLPLAKLLALAERTEGWITGLQLAAISLQELAPFYAPCAQLPLRLLLVFIP